MRELYAANHSQAEVASMCGVSQKVVWRLMGSAGIERRRAAKRYQLGHLNSSWKGDAAGYDAFHARVIEQRGQPSQCEDCGTTTAKRYEWASLTRNYADVNDYKRLCVSCHHRMDGTARNLGAHAQRKAVSP